MAQTASVVTDGPTLERRIHRRVPISLPISIRRQRGRHIIETAAMTADIAAGGICFETEDIDVSLGETVSVRVPIPVDLGYLPVLSRATAEARVVRVEPESGGGGEESVRVRVAAQFTRPMTLAW